MNVHAMRVLLGAALFGLCNAAGYAQTEAAKGSVNYPAKTIRMLVGFAAGGGTDAMARLFAQKFTEAWQQNVVVDNRPGASGNIAADILAKSVPDGHTLLMTVAAHAVNASLYSKLPFDPVKDFAPVSLVAVAPNIITAHPSVSARSARELLALAKSKPGQITYASAGNGTTMHLTMELFMSMAGIQLVHVPYNGGGPSTIATLAGQTQLLSSSLPTALPHVRSGKLIVIGVTSAERTALAPDLPTIAESADLPGYEVKEWYGILAPAGTPAPVINKLNAEIERLLQDRAVRERLNTLGFEPYRNTPAQFTAMIKSDIAKWQKVVRASGARID
jgi:tripartite-type tricarboxylate transporter receptor subunit TctC